MDNHIVYNTMETLLIYLFGFSTVCSLVSGCLSNTAQYKRSGENLTLTFKAVTVDGDGYISNTVASPNNATLLSVLYRKGQLIGGVNCNDCVFVGDAASGDLSLRKDKLETSDAGVYKHIVKGVERTCVTVYTLDAASGALSLRIDNLEASDARVYKHIVTDVEKACVTVYILGVPAKPTITINREPTVGENVTLTCSSSSTTIPRNHGFSLMYTWKVDGQTPSDSRYTIGVNRLTITHVLLGDGKKQFTCSANENVSNGYISNSSDPKSLNVLLKVASVVLRYNGIIPSNDDTIYTIIGVSETLTCTPSISQPPATIVWYFDNLERQRGTSTEYTYIPDKADDKKTIYCKAFNIQVESDAVTSQQPTLKVTDLESSTSFFVDGHLGQNVVTIDEHNAVNMTCSVDTQPASTITMTFERNLLTETNGTEMLTFTRRSVECTHSGIYMCTTSYYGHKTSKYLTLHVNCSPRPLRQTKQNVTTELNVFVTLSFTVIAYPEPGYKGFQWFKEDGLRWTPLRTNEDIAISSTELKSNLTILNVSTTDYGQYRVTATNSIGSYEQYLFISKAGESSGADLCTIVGKACTDNTQTALIVGVILGIVCVVVTVYASYLTVLYRILTKRNGNTSATGQTNKRPGHEEIEDREYEHPMPIEQSSALTSSSTGQYTDLSRLAGEEKTTYDTLQI